MKQYIIEESPLARFLFANQKMSWVWLVVRVYVGWSWLEAGWGKVGGAAWTGDQSGTALAGFIKGALAKTAGAHPDVTGWYGAFLQNVVLPHVGFWSHLIAYGELLVGVALILGIFTGIAAFFGLFMNFSYMLAGTLSTNPILFALGICLIMAWRIAGYLGLDYFVLPWIGTPWHKGKIFGDKSTGIV